MIAVYNIVLQIAVLLFSVSLHEAAHAWAAYKCGDPTARLQGRITLNPLAHIDPLGSIIIPGFLVIMNLMTHGHSPVFGWAKPVMVNPANFRRPRLHDAIVSAAGPLSNLLLALLATLPLVLFSTSILLNFQVPTVTALVTIAGNIILVNIILTVFNLLPIPPLDGSHILGAFLRGRAAHWFGQIQQYGFFLFLIFISTSIFDRIAVFVIRIYLDIFPVMSIIFGIIFNN